MKLLLGDCLEQMKALADNSVDAVVTDPPYGLAFMNKKWDYDVPSVDVWREVFRVLKPGGHVLSFGGTRTYHRMVVNIEDAGFEIRDQVQWIYGSGFPKSTDVSKRIDKEAGVSRKVIGKKTGGAHTATSGNGGIGQGKYANSAREGSNCISDKTSTMSDITAPATPEAKQWDGWGSALKPANEPICLARKPLEKGLTLAQNVLKWGTGAINVDGCRIGTDLIQGGRAGRKDVSSFNVSIGEKPEMHQGRWPANVLFDEDAAKMLDVQSGTLKSGARKRTHDNNNTMFGFGGEESQSSEGGASRFFYVAKASKRERNAGLEGMPEKVSSKMGAGIQSNVGNGKPGETSSEDRRAQNFHPTVKPICLMEYLITLITPPNGTVLDPFMGSGSTGVAARRLGFDFIGCEMSKEYMQIAIRRIEFAKGEDSDNL